MFGGNHIRKATNKDSKQIIPLIDKIYREYGDFVNTQKYDKDLLDIQKNYFAKGGYFWVYEIDNQIIGTIAILPKKHYAEIKRLYLQKEFRGSGIADILLNKALEWARLKGFRKIILWSDVRFKRAHNFYKKHNFIMGEKRLMFDANYPYEEFLFVLDLEKCSTRKVAFYLNSLKCDVCAVF